MLFAPFALLILIAGMLIAAATTFTVCAAMPALRKFSITAPAASLVVSPAIVVIGAGVFVQTHHMFILSPDRFTIPVIFLIAIATVAVFFLLGWTFALFCRAILEYVPPFLETRLGIQPLLLLQTVLAVGAVASVLVNFTFYATLVHACKDRLPWAICFGVLGVVTVALGLRPLLHLQQPQRYAPDASPAWLKRILFTVRKGEAGQA